jgi:hypothetical protein
MTLLGHIQNGVIVLDEKVSLPEGAAVHVHILPQMPISPTEGEIPTLADRLKDFIGILELPEDAARNHDHYLYGTPKKQ